MGSETELWTLAQHQALLYVSRTSVMPAANCFSLGCGWKSFARPFAEFCSPSTSYLGFVLGWCWNKAMLEDAFKPCLEASPKASVLCWLCVLALLSSAVLGSVPQALRLPWCPSDLLTSLLPPWWCCSCSNTDKQNTWSPNIIIKW